MQYFSNLIEMLSDLARHLSSILHSIVSLSQVNVQLSKKMELSQERELTHQREQMSATLNFHVLEHTQNTQLPNHPRHQTSLWQMIKFENKLDERKNSFISLQRESNQCIFVLLLQGWWLDDGMGLEEALKGH